MIESSDASPKIEDRGETLREVISKLRETMETQICNTSSLELQQVLHPLSRLCTAQDITLALRKVTRVVDRLFKYKSDPSNDVNKLEKLSRIRQGLRASKGQFQSLTRQLQENSIVFRVNEISSSKHEKLLARLELCSVCSDCDFFVTRSLMDLDSGQVAEEESSVDIVTISTTSLLIDISVDLEKGIKNVSFRFFSQNGDEFTDDKLCQILESWLKSERFSIFEEKLRNVWKLDKMDQHVDKVDVVKLLHHLRSLFRNVYLYESSKKFCIQDGHGWILPDLEGVVDLFYTCCRHKQVILQGSGYHPEDFIGICRCCTSCMCGIVSIRQEPEEKEIFFPPIPEQFELEEENMFPVDLQKWIGVGNFAELSFLFCLDRPIKMTLTTARLLYSYYEEEWTSRPYSGAKEWLDSSHMPCVLLEESLLEDCGYPLLLSSRTGFQHGMDSGTRVHRDSSIESYLEYEDGRKMSLMYSLPLRFSPRRRCVRVDCIPFLRVDKFIGILGILRQQLVFNQLFQSVFCNCYVDGTLCANSIEEPMYHSPSTQLVTRFKERLESSECHFELVVHPPVTIQLYFWRRKGNEELAPTQVIISIGSHGMLKVSMDYCLQHVIGWFENLLATVVNIPVCLFHLWERLDAEDQHSPMDNSKMMDD